MSKSGYKCAAIAAGAFLLIAAGARAGEAPMVTMDVGDAVGAPGQQVVVNVTLTEVANDKTCDVTLTNISSENVCNNRQTQYGCDASTYIPRVGAECSTAQPPTDCLCEMTACFCTAGTQNDIGISAPLAIPENDDGNPDCTVGGSIATLKSGTVFSFVSGGIRGLVLSLSNTAGISPNTVLYTCKVDIAADAEPGVYPLPCVPPIGASNPGGIALETTCEDGEVEVIGPPTETPTDTPEPTPTDTPIPTSTGTATNTPLPTDTPLPTNTRASQGFDDDSCAIVAPVQASNGWLLLLPAAALLWLRRRSR